MKRCPRCNHWHHGHDSDVCDKCWEDLGQMSFFQDETEAEAMNRIQGVIDRQIDTLEDDQYPVIDTVFDREEEARGYQ